MPVLVALLVLVALVYCFGLAALALIAGVFLGVVLIVIGIVRFIVAMADYME